MTLWYCITIICNLVGKFFLFVKSLYEIEYLQIATSELTSVKLFVEKVNCKVLKW